MSPFSIETELLHIHPAELRFASEEREEYISLINRTDDDVIYAITYDHHDGPEDGGSTMDDTIRKRRRVWWLSQRGLVPPQCTRAVPVVFSKWKKSYQVGVMMMMSSRTAEDLSDIDTYDEVEELMNQVRAEGGKTHVALLACVARDRRREMSSTG
jgi:hypothetical protein